MTRHKARPKKDYPKPWTPSKPRDSQRRPGEPAVSDHAVIRYLQRVVGIDADRLRQQLLADGRADLIRKMQAGRLHTGEGYTLIVKNCVVVSVIVPGNEDP